MRKRTFWISYIVLLIAQLMFSNFFHVTPYIMLSILPVMVLCIPIRVNTFWTLLIAFLSGLTIDWLSEGLLGLNALAMVPVAFVRRPVISLVFGNGLFARQEDFTVTGNGPARITLAIFLVQALFLLVYIWADGAGMRPFLFNLYRFLASLGAGVLVSLFTLNALAPDTRK